VRLPGRILVFAEDPFFLKKSGEHLKGAGLELMPVQQPRDVLSQVLQFKPDLILIDQVAPGGSASEVVGLLRGAVGVAGIPLAFVLADVGGRELVRALRAGAVEVMSKPVGPVQVERITQLLESLAKAPPATCATWEEQVAQNFVDIVRRHKLSGALLVNRGTSFEERISFKDGALGRASYGPLLGMDAIREILQREDVVFERDSAPDGPPPRIPHDFTHFKRDQPGLGPGDTVDIRPRALAVEDEPDLLALVSKHLTRAGFDVTQAKDGRAGVEAALATPFDLIVSGLVMPEMDGWMMLKVLKADHRTSEVPVIILSAHEALRETLRAARAGAYDYFAKTGFLEPVVSSALAALTPRLEALFELLVSSPLTVRAQTLGLQWTLRALARVKSSGVLAVQDDYGSYRLEISHGQPVAVWAEVQGHPVSGPSALAQMLVSRSAQGTFTHGSVGVRQQESMTLPMEELIQHTCEGLNAAEAKLLEQRLASAAGFDVDRELYELFQPIASPGKVALARAVCEEKIPRAELSKALRISAEDAEAGFRELLFRGVIKIRKRKPNAPSV
jgi:DNA-binding response OmpR family regulator